VAGIPELGGDEELGAGDTALLDRAADCWLGAVDAGSIDVSVLF
jgi:hypothetical protein